MPAASPAVELDADVVIYGGTSAGVIAAVQTSRMGKNAVLVSPMKRLGGLTTSGLGATDSGNKAVIGGLAREFYRRVKKHYDDPAAWIWQRREDGTWYLKESVTQHERYGDEPPLGTLGENWR